ncbi:hypothetical protein BD626DRAFT_415190, partial [Schizophyllum amplum]
MSGHQTSLGNRKINGLRNCQLRPILCKDNYIYHVQKLGSRGCFADDDLLFRPRIRTWTERSSLVARNPVAAARFFNVVVRAFIKHVLGVGAHRRGIYGPTSAYYGAVEQQGRLTLHLHTMLWIRGALSPQDIRDKLLAGPGSDFEKDMIRYLEEMQTGQFLTGDMDDVKKRVEEASSYEDPTQTLPDPPPNRCACSRTPCSCAEARASWWARFKSVVDDLILRVQIHKCIRKKSGRSAEAGDARPHKKDPLEGIKGCKTDEGVCDARFPREYVKESYVDRITGAIHLVKKEVMMNCVTPVLTYLTRGNTDTTSLQSGTSVKSIIMYVSDYISKSSLKTYHIMSCIKGVFERNGPVFEGSAKDGASARKLMLQMVNALAPRMELGSPMASAYLLGHPDHYTSHEFVVFWWKNYVNHVLADWPSSVRDNSFEERVVLRKEDGQVIGVSLVDDYVHRPAKYENYSLYEWVQCSKKTKRTASQLKSHLQGNHDSSYNPVAEHGDDEDAALYEGDADQGNDEVVKSRPDDLIPLSNIPDAVPLMDGSQRTQLRYTARLKYEPFLGSHPQHNSHHVHCDPSKRHYVVPNFVGGAVPRSDQGDREYYCATMLTLFSPWRRGQDLKDEGYNWDAAFLAFPFSERNKQLMRNFNLRYECADARDDFHNEMKKKRRAATLSTEVEQEEEEGDGAFKQYGEDLELDVPDDGETGNRWNKTFQTIDMARIHAAASGWTEEDRTETRSSLVKPEEPRVHRRGSEWASYVKELKDYLFKARMKTVPSLTRHSADGSAHGIETGVVTLPPHFFTRDYTIDKPDLRETIDNIISEYELNMDQQRAFTLIANHA